jgi:hypothetical protein
MPSTCNGSHSAFNSGSLCYCRVILYGSGVHDATTDTAARHVPLVRGGSQTYRILKVSGFFQAGFISSERRQYSGSLLRDLGATLLIPRIYMGTPF